MHTPGPPQYSDLAQLVEQAAVNRRVAGSSPAVGATDASLAVGARIARGWDPRHAATYAFSVSATRHRSTGRRLSSNQGFFFIHSLLRQLGCGSGM